MPVSEDEWKECGMAPVPLELGPLDSETSSCGELVRFRGEEDERDTHVLSRNAFRTMQESHLRQECKKHNYPANTAYNVTSKTGWRTKMVS
jgi:hypothetical protein